MPTPARIPETRRLTEVLPTGREGGLEFARIVDLLLFHEARREGRTFNLFSDRAGDYGGMDSFADSGLRVASRIGYQYKFYPSPLSNEHRAEIKAAIAKAQEAQQGRKQRRRLTKLVIVTPDDLTESGRREGGGDLSWFDDLRTELHCKLELEHWGHRKLQALFLDTPVLCLFYYPELVPEGAARRRTIDETRQRYDRNLQDLYGRIELVGMSVYKPEATRGVPMEHIYIPLATVPEQADDRNEEMPRGNPLDLLHPPGGPHVILGDPGSGKSTLLKLLTLAGRCDIGMCEPWTFSHASGWTFVCWRRTSNRFRRSRHRPPMRKGSRCWTAGWQPVTRCSPRPSARPRASCQERTRATRRAMGPRWRDWHSTGTWSRH